MASARADLEPLLKYALTQPDVADKLRSLARR
jgi:hypothetical protein